MNLAKQTPLHGTKPRRACGVTAAILVLLTACRLDAQESGGAPGVRGPISFGAGVGVGWGPFATDSGPWVDVFGIVDTRLYRGLYLRLEPGLAAGRLSDERLENLGSEIVQSKESLDVYGVMARGLVGYDLADWFTLRLGVVGGYLAGSFESSVCPDESYSRGQYGLTTHAAVRLGERRNLEVGIQAEALAKFANPRCRPRVDETLPIESRFQGPYVLANEPSARSLGFLSLRVGYIWF